jgi:hypothetical protein
MRLESGPRISLKLQPLFQIINQKLQNAATTAQSHRTFGEDRSKNIYKNDLGNENL